MKTDIVSRSGHLPPILSRHIGDFTDWMNHNSYQQAFDRLLRDLKAGQGGDWELTEFHVPTSVASPEGYWAVELPRHNPVREFNSWTNGNLHIRERKRT